MNYIENLISVKDKINEALSRNGAYDLDMYKYLSNHPTYEHIFLVLARDIKDRYVTFEFHNIGHGKLQSGIYAIPTLKQAMEDIRRRECYFETHEENPAYFIQVWSAVSN